MSKKAKRFEPNVLIVKPKERSQARREAKLKAREMADVVREHRKELKLITREKIDLDMKLAAAAGLNLKLQVALDKKTYELLETENQRDFFREKVEAICDILHDHIALKQLFKMSDAPEEDEFAEAVYQAQEGLAKLGPWMKVEFDGKVYELGVDPACNVPNCPTCRADGKYEEEEDRMTDEEAKDEGLLKEEEE